MALQNQSQTQIDITSHPRDAMIEFEPKEHKYTIDGVDEGVISATGLLEEYFEEFDAEKIIDKYYDNWQERGDERYSGKSKEEIAQKWEENREEKSRLGTKLHEKIEHYYKNNAHHNDLSEIKTEYEFFKEFIFNNPGLSAEREEDYKSEWKVCTDLDLKLAGTLDMCFKNSDGTYDIYDWKRAKNIETKESYSGEGKKNIPGTKIPNTNYHKYSLQLTIYKYILQKYYGIKIRRMCFVQFHPKQKGYIIYEAWECYDLVKCMMKEREKEVGEKWYKKLYNIVKYMLKK